MTLATHMCHVHTYTNVPLACRLATLPEQLYFLCHPILVLHSRKVQKRKDCSERPVEINIRLRALNAGVRVSVRACVDAEKIEIWKGCIRARKNSYSRGGATALLGGGYWRKGADNHPSFEIIG